MSEQLTGVVPEAVDSLDSLRDSYALHLAATRSARTAELYLAVFDRFLRFLREHGMPTGARAVRREHVEAWLAARRAEVRPGTIKIEFEALRQFFRWAEEEEEIGRSPMAKLRPPSVPTEPVPVITPEQLRALLRAVDGRDFTSRRNTAIVLLLFDTGIRAGELVGMTIDDLDLRRQLVFVTGSKSKDVRAVPFGTKTAVAIDRYLRLRRRHRHAGRPEVWLGQDGPLTTSGLAQIIAKASRRAGLPRLHPHQFRHSFAHSFLAAGGNETDLQRLAGWRSPLMLRRYGASLADERARANYRSPVDLLGP
jgi:site-specific recombinase XerD